MEPKRTIYMVSDGTCRTCEQVARAALVQFDREARVVRKANVRRPSTVKRLVKQAAAAAATGGALVFYTLADEKARRAMSEAAREHMVPTVDILGPPLVGLYDLFKSTPRAESGILYRSNREYYDRMDAVEYTLHHDDGAGAHELDDADVVLVGVSRAGKSTTCFYLAYSGIRAANVPILSDGKVPSQLLQVDPRRVIVLTSGPHRLQSVREARLSGWGMGPDHGYVDIREIARELRAVDALATDRGWRQVTVGYKAVEEIARDVTRLLAEAGIHVPGSVA